MRHKVVSRFSPGLITVEAYIGPRKGDVLQPWGLNTGIRKDHRCCICQRLVAKGTERMFAPIGNTANRYRRICIQCVHRKLGPPP